MQKQKFKLILLGTDGNAYGMARLAHQRYEVKSLILGKRSQATTKHSRIVDIGIYKNLDKQEVFVNTMKEIGKKLKLKYDKLILISCGDTYTELIINNKQELKEFFITPYIDKELYEKLENKDSFYQTCQIYQFDFPETYVVTYEKRDSCKINFSFPVIVKANDSIRYLEAQFEGRRKAYIALSQHELDSILGRIYNSSYRGNIIVQDYIPGDNSASFVLSSYSNKKGEVKLMSWGDVLLEHCHPNEIGNYAAIISSKNQEMYYKIKKFLETIKYVGYAHFDIKYDERDQKYKFFEMNIRQGRGSYYINGSGYNIIEYLIEEYVYQRELELAYCEKEWLWLDVPKSTLLQYVNVGCLPKIRELLKKRKYGFTLFYWKDFNIKRYYMIYRLYKNAHKIFLSYFNQKGF